ncbi:MAG: sialidase family protein, partial [Candidatus Latescibacterota bacterium]
MKNIYLRKELSSVSGEWRTFDDINVSNVEKSDIYRSPLEPSFVCWPILWKEAGGALKLSFSEASGDVASWPPVYCYRDHDIECYVKTLVSHDSGRTWSDTGWRADLDREWQLSFEHGVRHVLEIQDGSLLRGRCRAVEGITTNHVKAVYDETKALEDFPFTYRGPFVIPLGFNSTWKSGDGGKTWEEISPPQPEWNFIGAALHQLRSGSIVATGAITGERGLGMGTMDQTTWRVALTESPDGGRTWSDPQVLAENDDLLASQSMDYESDFVELADGRLLLVQRTDGLGMNMVQMYVSRDGSGRWTATRPEAKAGMLHSGYPYMCRASDGTIFCYLIPYIVYSCDDGVTWNSLRLGNSYYGQLVESSPGRIVAITHTNIGDGPFPWRHDTAMLQTSFCYERIGVAEQTDADRIGAVAMLGDGALEDFHLCAEVRVDGEAGVAFNVNGDTYGFVAVVIPCNEFRAPGRAGGTGQDAIMMIGRSDAGRLVVLRKQGIGKVIPGS